MKFISYDYWVGLYEDKVRCVFYICFLPCFTCTIKYKNETKLDKLNLLWLRITLYSFMTGWLIFLGVVVTITLRFIIGCK